MGIILNLDNLSNIQKEKEMGSTIVLVGGCFDILHTGHIEFLKSAKRLGNILVVMLESDKRIKEIKGENRPVNNQNQRSTILSSQPSVDFVIKLPYMEDNKDYEILVKKIKPDIIAVTAGSKIFDWEKEYMINSGGKIIEAINRIEDMSTTRIAEGIKL